MKKTKKKSKKTHHSYKNGNKATWKGLVATVEKELVGSSKGSTNGSAIKVLMENRNFAVSQFFANTDVDKLEAGFSKYKYTSCPSELYFYPVAIAHAIKLFISRLQQKRLPVFLETASENTKLWGFSLKPLSLVGHESADIIGVDNIIDNLEQLLVHLFVDANFHARYDRANHDECFLEYIKHLQEKEKTKDLFLLEEVAALKVENFVDSSMFYDEFHVSNDNLVTLLENNTNSEFNALLINVSDVESGHAKFFKVFEIYIDMLQTVFSH